MTPIEIRAALALTGVTFLPGCAAKRWARALAYTARLSPDTVLTDEQRGYLWQLVWMMRRQLGPDWAGVAAEQTGRAERPGQAAAAEAAQLALSL